MPITDENETKDSEDNEYPIDTEDINDDLNSRDVPEENEDREDDEYPDPDTGDEPELGECRLHPPIPVNLFETEGKKSYPKTIKTIAGEKPLYSFEFPQCSGSACETYWCEEEQRCSIACRHDAECHSVLTGDEQVSDVDNKDLFVK